MSTRSDHYGAERKKAIPSVRAVTDTELTERITAIRTEPNGTCGRPRAHRARRKPGTGCATLT